MKVLLVMLMASAMGFSAQAIDGVEVVIGNSSSVEVLNFETNHEVFGSRTFRLKRMANQRLRNMGLDADDYALTGVRTDAKSLVGNGRAILQVGGDFETQRVPDSRIFGYGSDAESSYNTLSWSFSNNPGQQHEAWLLTFDGRIKISSIRLRLERR